VKQRLHVAIAHAGVASRRKAEELIALGSVKVNGKIVKEQGTLVDPTKDKIIVNGKPIHSQEAHSYYLMYKPRGVVSTVSDPDHKKTILDVFGKYWRKIHAEEEQPRLYPVGRLDEESEGLILLTDDGDLAYKLTHPKFEIQKIYHVLLKGAPTNTQLNQLRKGVRLKEGVSKPDSVEVIKHEEGNTWVAITLHQGLHRQVRRTCAQVGLMISKLIRVKMGSIELHDLKPGDVRTIDL
jgi:pseudouridine synthase